MELRRQAYPGLALGYGNRPPEDSEGVPDERRGNVVKAFVVLAAGHEPSDGLAEEIKTFVRERHSAYAYPCRIEFVSDLPKTLTGKIRRIELRQREQEAGGLGSSPGLTSADT